MPEKNFKKKKAEEEEEKIANSQSKQNESQSNQSEPVKVKINLSIRTIELGTKGLQTHISRYVLGMWHVSSFECQPDYINQNISQQCVNKFVSSVLLKGLRTLSGSVNLYSLQFAAFAIRRAN